MPDSDFDKYTVSAAGNTVGRVDLNHADVEALAALPGIGLVVAQTAVKVRESENGFRSFEDFCALMGLNPFVRNAIRNFVTLTPYDSKDVATPEPVTQTDKSHKLPADLNNDPPERLAALGILNADQITRLVSEREKRVGFETLAEIVECLELSETEATALRQNTLISPIVVTGPTTSARSRIIDD